jgi:hypothetical protein
MSPEQNEFRELRRLLALKRHEQPPPGYFDRFSAQVITRIRLGEPPVENSWFHRVFSEVQRAWLAFESKPAMAGALGLMACGLLAAGLAYSDNGDAGSLAIIQSLDVNQPMAIHAPAPAARQAFQPVLYSLQNPGSFTPPQSAGSIFEPIRRPRATLINYPIGQ